MGELFSALILITLLLYFLKQLIAPGFYCPLKKPAASLAAYRPSTHLLMETYTKTLYTPRLWQLTLPVLLLLSGCAPSHLGKEPSPRLIITDGIKEIEVPGNQKFFLKWEYQGLEHEPHVITRSLSSREEITLTLVKLDKVNATSLIITPVSIGNRTQLPDYAGKRALSGRGYLIPLDDITEIHLPAEALPEPGRTTRYEGNLLLDATLGAAGGILISGTALGADHAVRNRDGRVAVSTGTLVTSALAGAIIYPLYKLLTMKQSPEATEYLQRQVDMMETYDIRGGDYRILSVIND